MAGALTAVARFDARLLRGARVRAPLGHRIAATRIEGRDEPALLFLPPDGDWRSRRLVSADLARVLRECAEPVRLPARSIGVRQLAGLVLDGVLEFEVGGRFTSGAAAHRILFPGAASPPRGRLGRLSFEALQVTAACGSAPSARAADRLYRFNTRPASASWQRLLPNDTAARRFVGLERRDAAPGGHPAGTWHVWQATVTPGPRPGQPTWKLYVSPVPEATSDACRALLATLGRRHGPFSMKLGRTVSGVLRPDRLVAYFTDRERLRRTATGLRATLGGIAAQGVPFTASLGGDGLLSWGADFATGDALPGLALERSWRGWITVRLGSGISTALRSGSDDPVTFALDRVWLDGVNPGTWSPGRHAMMDGSDADQ